VHETLLHQAAIEGFGMPSCPSCWSRLNFKLASSKDVLPNPCRSSQSCMPLSEREYLSAKVRTFIDFIVKKRIPNRGRNSRCTLPYRQSQFPM